MRKLILLSSVFVLTMGVFAQNDADADADARETTQQDVLSEVKDIVEEVRDGFNKLYEELKLMSQQQTTAGASNAAYGAKVATSNNQERAVTAQQTAMVATQVRLGNQADYSCVAATGTASNPGTYENAKAEAKKRAQDAMDDINNAVSDGVVYFQNKLFEEMAALCAPSDYGGAAKFCTGSGNEHTNLSTLLQSETLSSDNAVQVAKLKYLKNLLFTKPSVSINPDLLEDPDTNVKNILVDTDRLKAQMSVGTTVFSMIAGNRDVREGVPFPAKIKERMVENEFEDAYVDAVTVDGMSKYNMFESLTAGSFGPRFMLQQTGGNSELNTLTVIASELMLNNYLQFEQFKLLEVIAASASIDQVSGLHEAANELSARISAANAR